MTSVFLEPPPPPPSAVIVEPFITIEVSLPLSPLSLAAVEPAPPAPIVTVPPAVTEILS